MTETPQPGPPWTPLKLIQWTKGFFKARGIDSARLDAEVLLAHVLDLERIQLYAQFDRPLMDEELAAFRALVKRRAAREPTAYLVGHREFWSLDFAVDQRVLIPRPDTEVLVEACLARLPEASDGDDAPPRLVDVGTGSGAIAIAVASERPGLQVGATDTSADALAVARENAAQLLPEGSIHFWEGDLLDPLPEGWAPLDMVVSNPPYIAAPERAQMAPDVLDFEPPAALFAGPEGFDVIRRLIPAAHKALKSQGWLLFEIGYRQGPTAQALLTDHGFSEVEILKDYGRRDRVALGRRR